jgi:hypothetical protein
MTEIPSTCPVCLSAEVRRLDRLSAEAWVDYARCARCGHVMAIPRRDVLPPDFPEDEDDPPV